MKIWSHSVANPDLIINAIFEAIFSKEHEIAAATYKGLEIPEGSLMPSEKDAVIDSQTYANYASFVEAIVSLIEDTYGLTIYYENGSPYDSFYYGALATNSDGSFILKFTSSFRISNHEAHRSKESQDHKKEEREALKNIINVRDNNKLPRVLPVSIIVNDKTYDCYLDAIVDADRLIEHAVSIMNRGRKEI